MKEKRYNHQKIEKKWQKYWEENNTYQVSADDKKPKYYVLDMFPYPSGSGLHVGHVTGYAGTDIISRFKRMQGFNVLHPMGWDSFGLPAEQYAIRTGTHPNITTQENINTYRRQLKSLGLSYDWSREFATSNKKYYKWTQWIFTKLYEMGLAYEANINVNFCPSLGTVLANEEVENGLSKEGGYPVVRKPLRQWILKITKYADRLIEDLDDVDWPDSIKRLQKNWIGKSEGASVDFVETKTNETISVFTTRPDTLFGATYMVLAPEHPLLEKIVPEDKKEEVKKYKNLAAKKSDLERTELAKEKTGVFSGAYATNPVNNQKIPIWISDYVLMGYGTGAIMAVPSHDERDFEFANKYSIEIKCVFEPIASEEIENKEDILQGRVCWTKDGKAINSKSDFVDINGLLVNEAIEKMINALEKNGAGKKTTSYKLRDWLFSRQRYWGEPFPILHFKDGTKRALDLDELPLIPPDVENYKPAEDGKSPLSKIESWVNIIDPKTKKEATRETNTMPQWAGSCWYYLRFCDPRNEKEAWDKKIENYWMPVDLYVGGAEHAVLHLLYARFWHKVLYDLKLVSTKEPFKKFRCQGVVTAPSYKLPKGGYVDPENVKLENGKYIDKINQKELDYKIEKMSKSKLNGVTPDSIIVEFGADSLRLYEMFMGPFDKEKIWNTDAVSGCYRFLNRFYDLATSEKLTNEDDDLSLKLSNRLVWQVSKEFEEMQFNTAIAHMMEFINDITKLKSFCKKSVKMAVQMLYPFAPHLGEELWSLLGETGSVTFSKIFEVDKSYLVDDDSIFVIQVNGKKRAEFKLAKGTAKEKVLEMAKEDERVTKHLTGDIIKTIFVPGKLLSIVIKTK
jgi:leucyl-tRNA synthetase